MRFVSPEGKLIQGHMTVAENSLEDEDVIDVFQEQACRACALPLSRSTKCGGREGPQRPFRPGTR